MLGMQQIKVTLYNGYIIYSAPPDINLTSSLIGKIRIHYYNKQNSPNYILKVGNLDLACQFI